VTAGAARRTLALAAAAVALVAALAIALSASRPAHGPGTANAAFIGTPVGPQKPAGDALLRDGTGRPAHVIVPGAAATVLFFGYTHCPDECPLALAALGRAYRMLPAAAAARTRIVFVTVDPARDTPAVVARYVRNFDPHLVGLTGEARTLADLRDAYGVRVDARTHEIAHGATVYAIDATDRVRFIYPSDTPAKDFAHDLALLAR